MTHDPYQKLQRRKRWSRWHRWFGITASLFVILLSITGIALNHTRELHLDDQHITSPVLLSLYSVHAPEQGQRFPSAAGNLTQLGQRLYLNEDYIGELEQELLGVVDVDSMQMLLLLLDDELQIRAANGDLLERLGTLDGLPAGTRRIGLNRSGSIMLDAVDGNVQLDLEAVSWAPAENVSDIDWSRAVAIPDAEYQRLAADWRGRVISLERLLLDLHSGRLFSMPGVLFMDAVAVMLLFLAGSGLWLWWDRRQ